MELHALQVTALNLGGFATGMLYGSGAYKTHRVLFALNVTFTVWNFVRLLSHECP
jgi:hypothetical protein